MSDVECPYCGEEQEINHDDGYGYSEDEVYEQQCPRCERNFVYHTHIHFSYNVGKAPCLNGGKHTYKPSMTYPKQYTKMRCSVCDAVRSCTEDELAAVMSGDK